MAVVSAQKFFQASADPARAEQFYETLKTAAPAGLKKISGERLKTLVLVLSASQFLADLLLLHPEYIDLLDPEQLQFSRQLQGLRREIDSWLRELLKQRDYAGALSKLREFKQREMLRIAARDLSRVATTVEIVRELSDLADACLETVFQICLPQLTERFGAPYHQDADGKWLPTKFSVIGLGKLGGHELNYSSDVDVVFLYSDEGHVFKTPPRRGEQSGKGLTSHQFFIRLAENFIAEVGRLTPEGMLFRIDLRLRPEGDAGPLVRSLPSYENYYAQWGQIWERMMLIKARHVAGDRQLAGEFIEMLQPFRYPRSLNERIFREVSAMKERIENEIVKTGEMDREVKRGRGGIREIEFAAQALQLLHAGKNPFLQSPQTIPTLEKLVQYKLLPKNEVDDLIEAYFFLRDVEHRLQMDNNQQTHTIPTERKARERLAKLMGFNTVAEFERAKNDHSSNVRRSYEKLFKGDNEPTRGNIPMEFARRENEWKKLLIEHSFRDPDRAFRLLREFVEGPGYVHVSSRTIELARGLMPVILGLCPKPGGKQPQVLSDPDRVLARLDNFVSAYGARASLYELWTTNPPVFRLLLLLFDRSEFLAEIAIRTPDMVDELEQSGRLRRSKTPEETLRDLRYGIEDEDQYVWMRRYYEAEFMRIGLRDILGLADFEQNLAELSSLADACLQYALEVVMRKYKLKSPPFCIIGLGKLGGRELNYGSDLDITFIADNKVKNLSQLQQYAVEVMDLLSAKKEMGSLFATDARLRPDGEKGLLVNTLQAYEDYYRDRAMLWEIQALTRVRAVAGNREVGEKFQTLAAALTNFESSTSRASAFAPDWKNQIARMRQRIEKERTPIGKNDLAIKTGTGGLMDAEFIAQMFCLENAWQEPNTMRALERIKVEKALSEKNAEQLIANYRALRRIEGILRRWSYAGETLLPDDPAPLYRVAVRCGFPNADEFMRAMMDYREKIRAVYNEAFKGALSS